MGITPEWRSASRGIRDPSSSRMSFIVFEISFRLTHLTHRCSHAVIKCPVFNWEVVQLVGLQTLDLAILVRVQASQPFFSTS